MTWTPCPAPQTGDTIRWTEPLWAEPTQARGRRDEIGEQQITAKVLARDDVMQLQVEGIEILSCDLPEPPASKIKPGDTIQRKRASIERGACEKRAG